MEDIQDDELSRLLDQHAHQLAEHFDTVRIFVTKHNGDTESTDSRSYGVGNFLAQVGQIQEWLTFQEQYRRNQADRMDQDE